jgi:hypothetical protein
MLEEKWLRLVYETNRALPSDGQFLLKSCKTRPDFFYADKRAAIYVDGPPHDSDDVAESDELIEERLNVAGYSFIRFHHADDWETTLRGFPDIFGPGG